MCFFSISISYLVVMNIDHIERIKEVETYLNQVLIDIHSIKFESGNSSLFRKALLCTFIDSLSATKYSNRESNRKRFTQLVHENWCYADRICPVHLLKFCENKQELFDLRKYIKDFTVKWKSSDDTMFQLCSLPTKAELSDEMVSSSYRHRNVPNLD